MSDNYPPGVTGNEWQIAGPEREWDETVECDSEGFTVRTISMYGRNQIDNALKELGEDPLNIHVAIARLRQALSDIETVDVDGKCPFVGDVTLQQYEGESSWECPICREVHMREVE